jgi:hypothetical protein
VKVQHKKDNNSNVCNQFATVKNVLRGEENDQNDADLQIQIIPLLTILLKKLLSILIYMNLSRKQDMTFGSKNITYAQASILIKSQIINV